MDHQSLFALIVDIVIFASVAYALWWICVKFELPKPVLWICGVILLLIALLYIDHHLAGPGASLLR